MTRVVKTPPKEKLRRYIERGLTQQQMAFEWERESDIRCSRSAIAMAIDRYGLVSARPRPRYESQLPWTVSGQHRMAKEARMLRLAGRLADGQTLTERELHYFQRWSSDLEKNDLVVTYDPRAEAGFRYVKRQPGDERYIRPPRA